MFGWILGYLLLRGMLTPSNKTIQKDNDSKDFIVPTMKNHKGEIIALTEYCEICGREYYYWKDKFGIIKSGHNCRF